MPAINEVLQQGRYRITQLFGKGETIAGYEAYDNVLDAKVLIKEIPVALDETVSDGQAENLKFKFADHAKVLTEIRHESLLLVQDYFSEADCQYLVMEVVTGKDLSDCLGKDKNSLTDVIKWTVQLLDALDYLHTRTPPIIYGDLKPQNIRLTAAGKIKLLAFGIAKNAPANANLSDAGQALDQAALHYSPLEQIWTGLDRASQDVIAASYDEKSEKILNQPTDARSDIYALGATLYHLLTARLPIDALERSIDILDGKPDPLPSPSGLNPKVPREISDVLMRALEIKRENRFDSALIMRQALRTAVVRVKERETQEAKKQNDLLEIPLAEHKKSEPQLRPIEQERLKIESEQKRQTELVEQRLRESEARRLEAEQRAAEAEKRLSENESKNIDGENASATVNASQHFTQLSRSADVTSEPFKQSAAPENSSDEFKVLFAEPRKDNKIWRQMSVAAVILVICCGAFFGIRFVQKSKTAELNQTISEHPTSLEAKAIAMPITEATPVPIVEATPETSASEIPSEPSGFVETPVVRPALRNRPTPPAPRIEKQTQPAPTKSKPKNKKAVTVDDLINPN